MTFNASNALPLATGLSLLAAGVLVVGSMAGCADGTSSKAQASDQADAAPDASSGPRVETVLVDRQDLTRTVEMPGTVEGYETADLYSKVGGYLDQIHVDIGDPIQKGQELARLAIPEMAKKLAQKQASVRQAEAEAGQAEAAIRQAEADLASAQAALDEATAQKAEREAELQYREVELDRYNSLVEGRSARRELLDQARFQHQIAKAALETTKARIRTAEAKRGAAEATLAKAQADHRRALARIDVAQADAEHTETMMDYATLRAPFDGYVVKRRVDTGAFIQPAEGNSAARPLLTVTRTDVVRIFLDVPMTDAALLDRGDRAVLDRVTALPGRRFEGEVTRYSPALEKSSRMMLVEVDLENPDFRLLPGYYGYVTVFLEEQPDTPVVPSSALLSDGEQEYVYVVKNKMAHKQPVATNYKDGTIVGIASGLEGGEQIIRSGGGQIEDGQRCTPVLAAE